MIKYLIAVFLFSTNALATTYYVSSSTGSDSNSGLSHAQAWKTVNKVNSTVTTSGDDVYFLSNDTWRNQRLIIDWGGTSDNRAVIGAYYWNGATEVIGVSGDAPTFDDGWNETSGTNVIVPTHYYQGVIHSTSDYTTVQDIIVQNTRYNGFYSSKDYLLVQRMRIAKTGAGGIRTAYTNHSIFRDNTITESCIGKEFGVLDPITASRPSAIVLALANNTITENNYIYNSWCEGILAKENGDYNIIRNNTLTGLVKPAIYMEGGAYNVIEQNMVTGTTNQRFHEVSGYSGTALEINTEGPEDGPGNLVRNNLVAFTNVCIKQGATGTPKAVGKSGIRAYGNTCINTNKYYVGSANGTRLEAAEVTNNLFTGSSLGAKACNADPTHVLNYNYFDVAQTDPDCNGVNDVVGGDLKLVRTEGWDMLNSANLPARSDFSIQEGSVAENSGGAETALVLSTTQYTQHADLKDHATCPLDITENSTDHRCANRSDPPDIGAFEIISTASSRLETLPFYMEVGTGAEIVTGTSYAGMQYKVHTAPGYYFTNTSSTEIMGTIDDEVYQTVLGQNGDITFDIPIDCSAGCDIKLKFVELYYGVTSGNCDNNGSLRQFHIDIEGARHATNFDICAAALAPLTALDYSISGVVTDDDLLTISLVKSDTAVDGKPVLAGIEIKSTVSSGLIPVSLINKRFTPNLEVNLVRAMNERYNPGRSRQHRRGLSNKIIAENDQLSPSKFLIERN